MSSILYYLDISKNFLNGSATAHFCRRKEKETNLQYVDLSRNLFSGELPDCWMKFKKLQVLRLDNNNFKGNVPSSMSSLTYLEYLQLGRNNLSGKIPAVLRNFNKLIVLDLGENKFSGSIPLWMGKSFPGLKLLRLRSNMLSGSIPPKLCLLKSLQILDLAHNNISRTIPECFGDFNAMVNKPNNSWYFAFEIYIGAGIAFVDDIRLVMKDQEYEYSSSIFRLATSMDLSCNNLYGEIPTELTRLQDNCTKNDDHAVPIIPNGGMEEEHDIWIDMKWFYMGLSFGFVVGFWVVLGPLAFSKTFRLAYFQYLDDLKYKVFRFFL
ncbi:receptor-like protein EIX2 [Malania oleifera]|uniref:receptor-like protein EIX2 n=1 Tax=Malania oleifera TaxID=397392 RepID=UPI0025AEAF3C|nr:receptor-like protein EIX2 [Malania oleifera]